MIPPPRTFGGQVQPLLAASRVDDYIKAGVP